MFALFLNSGTRFMSIWFVKMNICSVGQDIYLRLQTNICHDVIKHWTLFFFFSIFIFVATLDSTFLARLQYGN